MAFDMIRLISANIQNATFSTIMTDETGRALQDSSTSAAQGNRLAQDVVKTLLKDRTDTSFSLFWARILQGKTPGIQTIEEPKLPRKR